MAHLLKAPFPSRTGLIPVCDSSKALTTNNDAERSRQATSLTWVSVLAYSTNMDSLQEPCDC